MGTKRDKSAGSSRVLMCDAGAGMLAGARTDANGVPVKSYVKDLIRVGTYRDPKLGDTFDVTPDDLDRWVREFDRMNSNGVKVPVPDGHTFDSQNNRGYVTGLFHDGSTLFGNIDLIGEDAIRMASRTEVSIYQPVEFTDDKQNKYDRPIAHVALTPVPVISGQGGFVPITASRGGTERVPVYRLAQETTTMNPQLLAVAKALGVDCSACKTDQDLHDAILAKNGGGAEKAVAMARELDETKKALSLARTELEAAKKGDEGETNPRVLKLSRQSRALQLDQLVPASGSAMKAFVDAQKKRWCPDDDKALALSLSPSNDALFEGLMADLKLIDFKALGEQTRQARELGRTTPGADSKSSAETTRKTIDSMKALAPVK